MKTLSKSVFDRAEALPVQKEKEEQTLTETDSQLEENCFVNSIDKMQMFDKSLQEEIEDKASQTFPRDKRERSDSSASPPKVTLITATQLSSSYLSGRDKSQQRLQQKQNRRSIHPAPVQKSQERESDLLDQLANYEAKKFTRVPLSTNLRREQIYQANYLEKSRSRSRSTSTSNSPTTNDTK